MPSSSPSSRGRRDLAAGLRVIRQSRPSAADTTLRDRHLVADLCRMLAPPQRDADRARPAAGAGRSVGEFTPLGEAPLDTQDTPDAPPADDGLSPRLRQTLERLLAGDAEKEAARRLGVSRNTVHVYVKALYRRFGVNSRGELLSLFIGPTPSTPSSPSTPPAHPNR